MPICLAAGPSPLPDTPWHGAHRALNWSLPKLHPCLGGSAANAVAAIPNIPATRTASVLTDIRPPLVSRMPARRYRAATQRIPAPGRRALRVNQLSSTLVSDAGTVLIEGNGPRNGARIDRDFAADRGNEPGARRAHARPGRLI